MGEIAVILDREKFKMNEKNASESLEKISKVLNAGVPVFMENYSRDDNISRQTSTSGFMFFSNGVLTDKREFGINKEKNLFYLLFVGEPSNYQIIDNSSGFVDAFSIPYFGFGSPLPGAIRERFHGGGTKKLIIGEEVEKLFPNEIKAMKFASQSIHVRIPEIYSKPGKILYVPKDDSELKDKIEFLNSIASMNCLANMVDHEMSAREPNEPSWGFYAQKASDMTYVGGDTPVDFKNKFCVEDSDYVLTIANRSAHNAVAAVKLNRGSLRGDMFVRPIKFADVVEKSLAPEKVERYYPRRDWTFSIDNYL